MQSQNKEKEDMKIIIEKKTKYGNVHYYPVCSTAKAFADLMGTITLTASSLKKIKYKLNYEIEEHQEPLNI